MSKGADMSKHVLGPWRYVRSGYGHSRDFDIVSVKSGGRIASTPYENIAALIARAPDLLARNGQLERENAALVEALSYAQQWIDGMYATGERQVIAALTTTCPGMDGGFIRAALKLAKGEA